MVPFIRALARTNDTYTDGRCRAISPCGGAGGGGGGGNGGEGGGGGGDDGGGGGGDDPPIIVQGKPVDTVYDIDTSFVKTALPPVTTPSWAHLSKVTIEQLAPINSRIGNLPGTSIFDKGLQSKLGYERSMERAHNNNLHESNDNTGLGGNIGTEGGSLGGLHT